jgi:hypothetical protein
MLVWCWGLIAAIGMVVVQIHSARPGSQGVTPERWPPETQVTRDPGRPTLLIFVDPRCPCSSASVAEFGSIMDHAGVKVAARVVLSRSSPDASAWGERDFRSELSDTQPLSVIEDDLGVESRRFGIETSGHVLLYDLRGRLLFSGGITAARGHRGENYGRDLVLERILDSVASRRHHPVFGCPLARSREAIAEDASR